MGFSSMTDIVNAVKERKDRKPIAVAAAEKKSVLEAVLAAYKDGFVEPILIGEVPVIHKYVEEILGSAKGIVLIPAESPEESMQKAIELVNQGRAAGIMKGRIETGKLMSLFLDEKNGMRTGRIVASVGLLETQFYHKILACTDNGAVISPDLKQKKGMIENAVALLRRIGISCPKVAVLAALEVVNSKIPATVDAHELKMMNLRGEIKDCIVEGPISYDLAVIKGAAQDKGFSSPVAGDADLLVWPDVNTGNIVWKALLNTPGTRSAGYICGGRVPILGASRSGTFDANYMSLVLATL